MIDFEKLSDDKQIAFYLGLSDRVASQVIDVQNGDKAEFALKKCWNWFFSNEGSGDVLYFSLVDEETGITLIAEDEENELQQDAWNCIIDAIAFTSRKAYDLEKTEYYPEPIELVDNELIYHFLQCYENCFPGDKYKNVVFEYLLFSDDSHKKEWKKSIENIFMK